MKKVIGLLFLFALLCTACTQTAEPSLDEIFAAKNLDEQAVAQLKDSRTEELLDYLMTCFLNGELEHCQFADSSAAARKYSVWYSMLQGDMMPLVTETPQEYWDEWCTLAHRSYNSADQCPPEMPVLKRYLMLLEARKTELDTLFEELAAAGESTCEELEQIKTTRLDEILMYLMREFDGGALEDCQLNDGSVGTLKFLTWSGQLGAESIELVLESPQQYWNEWSAYAKMLYDRNGLEFLQEYDYPMCVRYVKALQN